METIQKYPSRRTSPSPHGGTPRFTRSCLRAEPSLTCGSTKWATWKESPSTRLFENVKIKRSTLFLPNTQIVTPFPSASVFGRPSAGIYHRRAIHLAAHLCDLSRVTRDHRPVWPPDRFCRRRLRGGSGPVRPEGQHGGLTRPGREKVRFVVSMRV